MSSPKGNCFTRKCKGRANSLLTSVQVEAFTKDSETNNQRRQCVALWDTGATNTLITENLAKELGLQSIGKQTICIEKSAATIDEDSMIWEVAERIMEMI